MDSTTIQIRRFTRSEYERMATQGSLRPDERVELIDGEIVIRSPQGTRHMAVLRLIARALEKAFGDGHDVRTQGPLAIGALSEPEPDVAVVTGSPDDYLDEHPTTALIVVEVSDSCLKLDRRKASLYAQAKIPEYWIANLVDAVLEVHRKPKRSARGEWSYAEIRRLKPNGSVRPLGAPRAKLKVSDLIR
jgi:Uma2 family endonuclease